MGAVVLRMRAEARRAGLSWLVVALLIGIAGGSAMAAAIGARRSETAYPRFIEAVGSPDLGTGGISAGGEDDFVRGIELLKQHPQVVAWHYGATPTDQIETETGRRLQFPSLFTVVEIETNNWSGAGGKLLDGRAPDPADPHEATVSFAAEADDLTVGSIVTVRLPDLRAGEERTLPVRVEIVGVHAFPGEFQSVNGASFPSVALSPAFYGRYRPLIDALEPSSSLSLEMRLAPGTDVDEFREDAKRRGILVELPLAIDEHVAGVQRTMRLESWSLWALSAVIALSSLAILSQAIIRLALPGRDAAGTLVALGMSSGQLRAVAALRAVSLAVPGAVVAVVIGVLGSTFTPVGLARIAEPDPGVRADATVLVPGAVIVLLVVVALSLAASWRTGVRAGRAASTDRLPVLTRFVRPTGAASSVGLRFAVDRGKGRAAVPVRGAIIGVAAGVLALVVAFTFRASVDHLLESPGLSGFTFDALVAGGPTDALVERLEEDPSVEALDEGGFFNFTVDGSRVLVFASEGDDIGPVALRGRAPRGDREIALGATTMRDLGVSIGDRVRVQAIADDRPTEPGAGTDLVVVGEVVVPALFFEPHEPGEGAAMSLRAVEQTSGKPAEETPVLVRLRPGVELETAATQLRTIGFVATRSDHADVATLAGLTDLPMVLAALLGLLAGGVLVHVMWTTLRRRRRELAVLATLGFDRRQTRMTLLTQALVLTVAGLAVGLVLGVAVSRRAWEAFAHEIAVVSDPRLDVTLVLAFVAATVLLSALVALVAGHRATRLRPAEALAGE